MTIITAEHLAYLDSFPKIADDGGAAWKLPKNLSLQDQLRCVIDDTTHHVGWHEYKMDLIRRLILAGADPLVMEPYSIHKDQLSVGHYNELWPASWTVSTPAHSCILGGCIAGGKSDVASVILTTLFHKGDAIPTVLDLADGTKINALAFAAVMQEDRIVDKLIEAFSQAPLSADHHLAFAQAAEQTYLAAAKSKAPGVKADCLDIIIRLGMAGAKLDPDFWNDKIFKSGNARLHIAGALIARNVEEHTTISYVRDVNGSQKVFSWSQEMDRRSEVIAEQFAMLKRNGIPILGDKKPKASQLLHIAAAGHLTACIPVLLEEGADPDAVNAKREKPDMVKGVSSEIQGMLRSWKAHRAISAVIAQSKNSAPGAHP